jgi:hypothetical protein
VEVRHPKARIAPRNGRVAIARRLFVSGALFASNLCGTSAYAEPIADLRIEGNAKTRPSTFRSLLPRELPADLSAAEVREFERRVRNLEIFDAVDVRVDGADLVVVVREKWTLIPSFEFSTGKTLADTSVELGATESNFLGTANALGGSVSYEQRGPNGEVVWDEHAYNPRRGAFGIHAGYESASLRFDTGEAWYRDRAGAEVAWRLPYGYETPVRVALEVSAFHERVSRREGAVDVPSGLEIGTTLNVTWDDYTWNDLAPHGYVFRIEAGPGMFVPAMQPRHAVEGGAKAAWAITETTVLTGQLTYEAVSAGNANHSALLGSVKGVRGLDDSFYRNHAQAVANVEARQAWRFASRWALQGALFADGASFAPFDAHGRSHGFTSACSVGGGARLIPTFLAGLLLRVDLARLLHPTERWFVQLGFSQYF